MRRDDVFIEVKTQEGTINALHVNANKTFPIIHRLHPKTAHPKMYAFWNRGKNGEILDSPSHICNK